MKKEKILSILQGFLTFLLWLFAFGVAVRLFEAAILTHYQSEGLVHLQRGLKGVTYDVLFFLRMSLAFLVVYLLIGLFSTKAAKCVFAIVGGLMLLTSMAMIMYFVSALVPLDRVFFDYSLAELMHISASTGSFVWWSYVCLALIPLSFVVVMLRCELKWHKVFLAVYAVLAIASLLISWPAVWLYDNRVESYEVVNKQEIFFKSLRKSTKRVVSFDSKNIDEYKDNIVEFQSMFPEDEFVNIHYPLAHIDKTPDVLSSYFDLDSTRMPNIVIIISEGLSREFSGYNSELPSATPFLDSLSEKSLTWVNCLSSSQRTFAVLPTILGNLPFGQRGFMQSSYSPQFCTLPTILKQNGYTISFFYGGWIGFDNMIYFMRDIVVDNYLPSSQTYPETMRNSWGLLDEYMFSESLKKIDSTSRKPRFDIYLTLSTHDPFEYPDKEEYTSHYKTLLAKSKAKVDSCQYEQYASFLYYDKCLRDFFKEYGEKPDFDNTIFIITGDHCFNGRSENLTRYHVPLVIWSPMLKEAKRFPAMAAHRDITPSLLAMLKNNYTIESPEIVSWVNKGLDTLSTFEAMTFTPQMTGSHVLENMVYHNYFYDKGDVYELCYENDVLKVKPTQSDEMVKLMRNYLAIDDYVMRNNALIVSEGSEEEVIFEIDSSNSIDYVTKKTGISAIDTLGMKNVFVLKKEYPLSVFQGEFEETAKNYTVHCEFDLYQPKAEECGELHIDISVRNKKVLNEYIVDYWEYDHYDTWTHISMTQTIDAYIAEASFGDILESYFCNRNSHKFMISNFKVEVKVLRKGKRDIFGSGKDKSVSAG